MSKPSDPVLQRILREADQSTRMREPFLAVFDLDSTLFDLTLRVSKILDAFSEDPGFRKKYPFECETLGQVRVEPQDWGIGDSLGRAGLFEADRPAFFQDIRAFWAECFFGNDYLHHDEPLPGAVGYVNALRKKGAHIMYLTGRGAPHMLAGTRESLKERGFPLEGPDVRLVLKTDAKLEDAVFKRDVLRKELHAYRKIWLFENEPVNLNLIARELPDISLVFIRSTHSGRESLEPSIDHIAHFEVDADSF